MTILHKDMQGSGFCVSAMAVLMLSGCSSWPEPGQGGMAEHYGITDYYQGVVSATDDAAMKRELEVQALHLRSLEVQGALRCIPASIRALQRLETRTRRELSGGLLGDAANDLVRMQHDMNAARERFAYVSSHSDCLAGAPAAEALDASSADVGLASILSVYFDTDSADLGAGYQSQLAWLGQELGGKPLHFTLVAHTDLRGSEGSNQDLAQARAAAVQKALLAHGIVASRITVQTAGEASPALKDAHDAAHQLNRRVDILVSRKQDKPSAEASAVESMLLKDWERGFIRSSSHSL